MAKKIIRTGTTADPTGDSLKNAFVKVNDNFTELYNALGLDADTLNIGAFEFTGSVMTTTDSSAIVIDQATTITSNLSVGGDIVPQTANGGDLGSSTLPWRSLYVSNNTIFIGGTAVGLDANGNLTTGGTVVGSTPAWANITGKPTFATVATTGAYADLTGKPTIPTLVSQLSNDSGFLTSVGNISNIQSESDVSIEINLSDSTKRIWRFGEDGELTFPNNTVQTDAFSGKSGKTVVLGTNASAPGEFGIALGFQAGANGGAGDYAIALGYSAGLQNQGGGATNTAVAIGMSAGSTNQGARGIAIGRACGTSTQGIGAIAIGDAAGGENQGESAIALGVGTASTAQGFRSIAIGTGAGGLNQGDYAIAIGNYAGTSNQHTNSIILNARSSVLNTSESNSFYVAPIRNAISSSGLLQYNATTKEVTYSSDIRSETGIYIDVNLSDSTLYRWQFGEDGNLTLPSVGKISNGAYDWTFGSTGTLTLPTGGTITEGGGLTGAIKLTPAGGANAYQALMIYPTAGGDGDHIHLTAGGGTTELYLGDDMHYVKLGKGAGYNGTIVIAAAGRPDTVIGIISSTGNWAAVSLSNLATTGGTGTGLTVTVTQVAGVATAIAIVSGAMEGYTANDTITVTSGAATATFTIGVLAPQWVFAPDGDLYIPSGNTIRKIGSGEDIRSIPGPYADDEAAALAGVALGSPYHKTGTNGQVFVRLTSPT